MIRNRINKIAEALPAWLDRQTYTTDLASGDRLAAAKANWPEEQYPTVYRDIPDDIRRPVIWDGRLLGGLDVSNLMWRHLTPEVLVEAVRESGQKAVTWAFAFAAFMFVLWTQQLFAPGLNLGFLSQLGAAPILVSALALATYVALSVAGGFALSFGINFLFRLDSPTIRKRCYALSFLVVYVLASLGVTGVFMAMEEFQARGGTIPFFAPDQSGLPYPEWAAEIGAWGPIVGYYAALAVQSVASLAGLFLASIAVFLLSLPAFWFFGTAKTFREWASATGAPYTAPTRDALLVYKSKSDGAREAEYRAYCRQVEDATGRLADLPVIPMGFATGTLRARGDMKAPVRGQAVAFDGESLRVHTMIFGDTGSGKTRDVLRPAFTKIMAADWGAGHQIGAYVTDGKGTLWRDLKPIAEAQGRTDIVVIGTGPDHYGVDLLKGMSPLEISTTFKAVAGQVAGKPSEDFWVESASLLLMHAAYLARLIESDPDTEYKAETWDKCRPYSLSGLILLTTNLEFLEETIRRYVSLGKPEAEKDAEREAGESDLPAISLEFRQEIRNTVQSLTWLLNSFIGLSPQTNSSIVANVNVVIGKLLGAEDINERFASGQSDRTIDVDHCLEGGIVMVAIGDTEAGLAGRVISTWLKQRLYVLAKRRLVNDPESCRKVSVALFADEFQMLVTSGQDSDTTFWNVARETGVFLMAATQSVAALNQVIGKDQTANIMNLLRNKIVLSTGEVETIDYIRKLAGDLPIGWEPEEGFYSTQTQREQEEPGVDLAATGRAGIIPRTLKLDTPAMRTAAALDDRFMKNTKLSTESANSAQQSAYWRQEDKSREAMVSGLNWTPKLRHDELRTGQGFGFALIYRAGVDHADIIDFRGV